jgi:hypothetical protein
MAATQYNVQGLPPATYSKNKHSSAPIHMYHRFHGLATLSDPYGTPSFFWARCVKLCGISISLEAQKCIKGERGGRAKTSNHLVSAPSSNSFTNPHLLNFQTTIHSSTLHTMQFSLVAAVLFAVSGVLAMPLAEATEAQIAAAPAKKPRCSRKEWLSESLPLYLTLLWSLTEL